MAAVTVLFSLSNEHVLQIAYRTLNSRWLTGAGDQDYSHCNSEWKRRVALTVTDHLGVAPSRPGCHQVQANLTSISTLQYRDNTFVIYTTTAAYVRSMDFLALTTTAAGGR